MKKLLRIIKPYQNYTHNRIRNMAKKDSHWFSHDANARGDKKIKTLYAIYGKAGICDWWTLVEVLREQKDYRLKIDDLSTWVLLSEEFKVTIGEAKKFIDDCINNVGEEGLLRLENGYFFSASLVERMDRWDKKREVLRERGRKGAEATNSKKSAQAAFEVGTSDQQATFEVGTSGKQATQKSGKRNETKQYTTTNVVVSGNESNWHFSKIDGVAIQLMTYRPDLTKEQAVMESKICLDKTGGNASASYIAEYARRICKAQRFVIMRTPFGDQVKWTEEDYEKRKTATEFKFVRYEVA